jgi:hypothetical protein
MRTTRKLAVATALLFVVALLPMGPASASVYEGTVDFTCTGVNATGSGAHILDRDNTGLGLEQLNIHVTDGLGNTIVDFTYENALATYGGGIGNFGYDTPPEANPLTFTLTSLAGNGLPEQVDFVAEGACDEIPYVPPTVDAPAQADLGETIAMTGTGCIEGPVTVRLLESEGGTVLATAEGLADGMGDFVVELTVPADAPPGDRVLEVWCGDEQEPISEVVVLDILITGETTTTTAPSVAPVQPAAPAAVAAEPRFTG